MSDTNKEDFIINTASGFESPKQKPDFQIHSVVGVADSLKPDFEIHGIETDEEDFVIHGAREDKTAEEEDFTLHEVNTTQPTRKEMPRAGDFVEIGEVDLDNIPIFMDSETFQAMEEHLSSLRKTQTPYREMGGAPIGRYCVDSQGREFVEILAYIPFTAPSTGGDIEIPEREWYRVHMIVDEMREKGLEVVISGWTHSHPNFTPAPSDTDVNTTNTHFNQSFMSALIYDPYHRKIGAFELDGRGGLKNKGGIAITGENRNLARDISYCEEGHL